MPRQHDQITISLTQGLVALAVVSMLIFWGSALIGVWAAYNPSIALGRFCLLSVGLGLIGLLTWHQWYQRQQENDALQGFMVVGLDSGLFAGGLGLLFLLTHNWQSATAQDFTLLPQLTAWIQAHQPLWGKGLIFHENLIAGALIGLLPLTVVALWQSWHLPQTPTKYWSLFGILFGSVALLLTFSRGAWLGLLGGSVIALYLHWRTNRALNGRRSRQHMQMARRQRFTERNDKRQSWPTFAWLNRLCKEWALLDWFMGVGIISAIGLLVGMTISPALHAALLRPLAGSYLEATINSRLAVWQESLPLIEDYLFTGSGLGSTPMVLATYVYLLHVPYLNHAHSLYLQVAVEQGVPGLLGFTGLIVSAIGLGLLWLRQGGVAARRYSCSALAAQCALLIYGCTDAELYASIFVPLLFLPTAFLLAAAPLINASGAGNSGRASGIFQPLRSMRAYWLGGLVPLVVLVLFLLLPGTQSRWLANQTTVGQTRQELSLYEWPTWPIQDAVRRSKLVDTEHWVAQYNAILQLDPTNVTALRRLGQIALSRGNYQQADELLTRAYQVAPQQRATRQLLGEAKALLGDDASAYLLWQGIDLSQGQLELRRWWYEQVDGELYAQQFAQGVETWQTQ